MTTCPNCNHINPEAAAQCEACLSPLQDRVTCPSCGASVLRHANFCGQCGVRLQASPEALGSMATFEAMPENLDAVMGKSADFATIAAASDGGANDADDDAAIAIAADFEDFIPAGEFEDPDDVPITSLKSGVIAWDPSDDDEMTLSDGTIGELFEAEVQRPVDSAAIEAAIQQAGLEGFDGANSGPITAAVGSTTKVQHQAAQLLHLSTETVIELPSGVSIVHIGKPNNRVPPDIDLSGFPHADVVSRIHADIRIEGSSYYLEDSSSANGTYVNNMPLPVGNRHRLRPGDRISLGKHDLVAFLFQLN